LNSVEYLKLYWFSKTINIDSYNQFDLTKYSLNSE